MNSGVKGVRVLYFNYSVIWVGFGFILVESKYFCVGEGRGIKRGEVKREGKS